MTYNVKNVYPNFKCVSVFRRVEKRIRMAGIRRDNRIKKFDNPAGLFHELGMMPPCCYRRRKHILRVRTSSKLVYHFSRKRVNEWKENDTTSHEQRKKRLNDIYLCYKKDVFYQAMLNRDYRTISLCDDVIGVIFEFL